MKLKDILTPSFASLAAGIRGTANNSDRQLSLVEQCRADDSDFCRETVTGGWLDEEQMAHAAGLYRLGKSRSGRCIFWMIDESGRLRDGHIGDDWVSALLKARSPELLQQWNARHCLFGLHLISSAEGHQNVAIVESERSAVILSELFPGQVWLSTVYPANFTLDLLEPLRDHVVTLFPNTDPTMDCYLCWHEIADMARSTYHLDITVSDILEQHATQDQKARKIDLVDFLFEASKRPE